MMTLEKIKSIECHFSENSITIKQRLHKLNTSESNFYYARRALWSKSAHEGMFIQLSGSPNMSFPKPSKLSIGVRKGKNAPIDSYMLLELRTESGTAMRIQSNFTSDI